MEWEPQGGRGHFKGIGNCSELNGSSLKSYIYLLTPEPVSVTLFEERVFVGVIKDLEITGSWIT